MDENLVCECGNTVFWMFKEKCRCVKCFNEYYQKPGKYGSVELLVSKFNSEDHKYMPWSHVKML